ncbi:YcgL domain-containing protein [Ketobacter sp.]|uniref:YcgL domain-containing protein n=1 Tax=Ketobacter sp. TaxID=2083498 RepID=UPI000F19D170|nr:YcgL domain-containing protein [Ketobacter sp.]RLT99303.1 MAG: YcgL domain-containing protein [Ketobacter sp.]
MSDPKIMCSVYRSDKKEGMYIYVPKQEPFEQVPEALMQTFGTPGHVMDLMLTPERTLARVDVKQVILGIQQNGYYLQMPPAEGHF